jgi:putative flippase GtrA
MFRIINKYKKLISPSFVKYVISGVLSLVADYGSFLLLYYVLNVSLQASVLVGLGLGFIFNFSMNKFWAFKSRKPVKHKPSTQLLLYSILFAFNYVFTYYLIHFLERNGIPPFIGKVMSTGCITAWNYYIYKLAIFKENVDVDVIIE